MNDKYYWYGLLGLRKVSHIADLCSGPSWIWPNLVKLAQIVQSCFLPVLQADLAVSCQSSTVLQDGHDSHGPEQAAFGSS